MQNAPNHTTLDRNAPKDRRSSFTLTASQEEVVDAAAARLGWSRANLVRHASVAAARQILQAESLATDGVLAGLVPSPEAAGAVRASDLVLAQNQSSTATGSRREEEAEQTPVPPSLASDLGIFPPA